MVEEKWDVAVDVHLIVRSWVERKERAVVLYASSSVSLWRAVVRRVGWLHSCVVEMAGDVEEI